ncbi:septum formation inhibitor Maf [Halioglobus maricola]|uniref:7-methyl-GTP pyrophosphatase n=1 Tax=Halioglobus maricola TaxID=2601894 RepID=A0A5P9NJV3_9GAMM|nr:Maf family nucleotide pyrophosphatase [Halioglobus maricola]QFU75869.1 septum formation inhibitor Maf [Halioglobus maricola]
MHLILASTSTYRRALLERLQLPFLCQAPDVDETPLLDEHPAALAQRLCLAKANSVATLNPTALVIGSDQVASIDGSCIGKPGNFENAAGQLRASSGRRVDFYTGLALVGRDAGIEKVQVERFSVQFRKLSDAEITYYLNKEEPWDCAGSFKCEGLGVALFERMIGDDPTSLEGLPLIALCSMLREAGVRVL